MQFVYLSIHSLLYPREKIQNLVTEHWAQGGNTGTIEYHQITHQWKPKRTLEGHAKLCTCRELSLKSNQVPVICGADSFSAIFCQKDSFKEKEKKNLDKLMPINANEGLIKEPP